MSSIVYEPNRNEEYNFGEKEKEINDNERRKIRRKLATTAGTTTPWARVSILLHEQQTVLCSDHVL